MSTTYAVKLSIRPIYSKCISIQSGIERKWFQSFTRFQLRQSHRNIPPRFYSQSIIKRNVVTNYSISPYPIRVALVGVAAILGTPAFVFAGFVQLWMRYLPKEYNQVFKIGSLLVIGGGLSKLSRDHVFPFLSNHSELVFPLALCNGIMASFWYGIGELIFGIEAMIGMPMIGSSSFLFGNSSKILQFASKFPIAGPTVGVLAAITSPFLWPKAFDIMLQYDMKEALFKKNNFWLNDAYDWIMFPIGVPIGAIAGLSLQTALSTVAKNPNGPWYNRSIPALFIMSGLSAAYYNFCKSPMEDYYWYRRIEPVTGDAISINPITNQIIYNAKRAEKAKSLRSDIGVGADWSIIYLLRNLFSSSNHRDYFTSANYQPKVYMNDKTLEISDMEEYQDLWTMIDILIRYRYLRNPSSSIAAGNADLVIARQELEKLALISVGINDLDAFAAQADSIVLNARNNIPISPSIFSSIESIFEDPALSNNGARARRSILLLQANVKLYEDELFHKLGYTITENNVYHGSSTRAFWVRSITSVAVGFCLGLYFLRSHN